ncbi:MAG: hypothetical protein FWC42_08030 [Proteobacteria bacterium]|nr:hypothetical protein [Pseudomonadota bacterium]
MFPAGDDNTDRGVLMVSKNTFLKFLDFPGEWGKLNLYSDELFNAQLKFLLEDIGTDEFNKRMAEGKYGNGSEHWRLGAFIWVIKNEGSKSFDKLKIVAQKEKDLFLMRHMLNEIARSIPD